jgi:hypothetical protein
MAKFKSEKIQTFFLFSDKELEINGLYITGLTHPILFA